MDGSARQTGEINGAGLSELGPVNRVVLKISGEALAGESDLGIEAASLDSVVAGVMEAVEAGAELAVVVGGGNIFRGSSAASALGIESATADYMSMLGTVINAIALQAALEGRGVETRVQSAIEIKEVAEPYIRRRAIRHLEKGRVVIFGGGTGNPFFTTDTGGALRALEIGADALLMAKNQVDGVYDRDPRRLRRCGSSATAQLHGPALEQPLRDGPYRGHALQRGEPAHSRLRYTQERQFAPHPSGGRGGVAGMGRGQRRRLRHV